MFETDKHSWHQKPIHGNLRHLGETNEGGTETEARTLARCEANAGGEEIQDGKHHRGDHGDCEDLLHGGHLAGDEHHRNSDGRTLEEILDDACQEFGEGEAVHFFIFGAAKKTAAPAKHQHHHQSNSAQPRLKPASQIPNIDK